MKKINICYLLTLLIPAGCNKHNAGPPRSSLARINSIIFRQADNHFVFDTDTVGHYQYLDSAHIQFVLPGGVDITHLAPTIDFSGTSISPLSGVPQDFTKPVDYFVTAQDGSKRGYTVSVAQTFAKEVIIGSGDGNVYSFDVTNGKIRWQYLTGGPVQSSPIILKDLNDVCIGSSDGNMYALDPILGTKLWYVHTSGPITSAAISLNYMLYVGSWDRHFFAINEFNGSIAWQAYLGGIVSATPTLQEPGDIIFVPSRSGGLYAFSGDGPPNGNGDTLALGGSLSGSVSSINIYMTNNGVSSTVIYYANGDKNIHAITYYLSSANVAPLWSFATGDSVMSSPVVSNGVLYAGSNDHNLYALNDTTGAKLWSFTTGGAVQSRVEVANGVVYAGSNDGKLYAINALTGAMVWSAATGGPIQGSCVVAKGVVYVGSTDHNLYAFSASDGSLLWKSATTGSIVGNPVVIGADSTVYY